MKATLEFVDRKFDEFNDMIFGGRLPKPPFRISHARTFLGKIKYLEKRTPDGRTVFSGFTFYISDRFDLPERRVEDTIIHEMIHYDIAYRQLHDNAPHGKLFRSAMELVNSRFGRDVRISHRLTGEQQQSDTRRRWHLICLTRFRNEKRYITVVAGGATLFKIWDQIEALPDMESYSWVCTTDPWFNRYPRSRTLKFYRADPEEIRERLSEVKALVREGNRITAGPEVDRPEWF